MVEHPEDRRESVREALLERGKTLLLTEGSEATTIADIVDPMDIDEKTFYELFDGKGELFFEIYMAETEQFSHCLQTAVDEANTPAKALEEFFTKYIEFFTENPYMRESSSLDHTQELIQHISAEKRAAAEQQLIEQQISLISEIQQQSDGQISNLKPTTVFGLLKPIRLLNSYALETDDEFYAGVQDALVSVLVRGLVSEDELHH